LKKTLLSSLGGVLLLIVVVYSIITWWSGDHIEQDTRNGIEVLNERLADSGLGPFTIKEIDYKRGVFSSEAVYVVSLASATPDAQPIDLKIRSKIDHGPLPLRSLLNAQFAPHLAVIHSSLEPTPYTEKLFEYTKGRPFIEGQTLLDLNGDAHIDWTLLPLDVAQNGVHTVFSGAKIKVNVGANLKTWQTEAELASLDLTGTALTVSLRGVRSYNNSQDNPTGVSVGTRGVAINDLQIKRAGLPNLKLTDLQSRFILNENEKLLDGVFSYDAGSLIIGTKDLGKLNLLASFDHLDAETVKSLANFFGSIWLRSLSNAPDQELITSSDVKAFWQQMQVLLKDKPSFHLNPVSLKSSTGESKLELHLAMAPAEVKPSGVGLTSNPLGAFHASLNVSRQLALTIWSEIKRADGMPENKAQQAAEKEINTALFLASIAKLVRVSGDSLSASLTLDQNVFKLNGNSTSASGFLAWLEATTPQGWLSSNAPTAQEDPDDAISKRNFDPQSLIEILTSQGRKFEQRKDEQRDPVIQIAPEDTGATRLEFVFVGCGSDPTCEDVVLRAIYEPKKPLATKRVSDWNQDHSLAKARINTSQEPVLEMDISTYGGLSKDSMQSMVSDFFGLVKDFNKALNQKVGD
jgi:uncharacterized protein YdgA (DUF945 family)